MSKNYNLKKIPIMTPTNGKYDITIGTDLIDNIGEYIKSDYNGEKITVITDKTVHDLYFERVKKALDLKYDFVNCIVVEVGEVSKSISTLDYVSNELALVNHRRSDLIIALGGGVIGDLAGFVASVYLRGVPFIQIPTTLLSQVDSSVGGKVAINIDSGKNLIGSFYNPLAVYIDLETLNTLEESQIKDGLGEVIKYGFIENKDIIVELLKYDINSFHQMDLISLIINCVRSKKKFVEIDFYDKKERMILNFGHTIAHAIEKEYGYGVVTHGQAVAAGMYMISKLLFENSKIETEVYNDIAKILLKYQMNIEYDLKVESTVMATLNDKKSFGDYINVIAVDEIGIGEILKIDIYEFEDMIRRYLNK
ncbi:MAG: 3-dehydroquinate synthase [Acidaminobacteraceae bacterium]